MINQRRFPRFFTHLKAYFSDEDTPYEVSNVSYGGLFIKTNKKFEKKLVYLELELPDIGRLPLSGIIVHYGTLDNPGIGIEIFMIEKNLKPVWSLYLKGLEYINEAKKVYQNIMENQKSS
ncbi:MAG: PilZ domain-containing protein [Thermodesulfobacteriaceae bacterium]|nr:PilZ domain-containing protein [Thermodesulfobacteriaceae bacterium]MCX8041965.1 PilZ domain-containing protein [Thermodesulfobacteriaceae bacterium]MDW8136163.1 PilZ domain-containing protein [Thermodesulfobacterium sp.]